MKSLYEHITEALDGSKMTYSGKKGEFVDAILQNTEGKILILRRANYMQNFRTCWGVIGGSVDAKDKTHKDAAIRETREETGYELSFMEQNNMKHLFDYTYKNGNISHVYFVKLESNINVKISREHSKYEWVDFSEEKIDDRKWMPEVFNILQKWEQTPINERLIINKNYNDTVSSIDDLIKEYVHFNEGFQTSLNVILLRRNLSSKIQYLKQNHSLLFDTPEKNEWIRECTKHLHPNADKICVFYSGELLRTGKFHSLSSIAESIETLISHIDEDDKQIIYSEEDTDGTLFEVFYVIGEKYAFASLGSTKLRCSYISFLNK